MANHRQVSGWAIGWTTFAAVMLMMVGVFQGIAGLSAVLGDELYVLAEQYVFKFDTTTWGWIHLLIALILFLAGLGLLSGAVWSRTVGVIVAILSAVANFAALPWYPVWSSIMIVVAILVIWALTLHGRDITAEPEDASLYDAR